ncbi:ompa/motb domain protein [Flammeovirgaceae bacterium 311]|nr:ompa/motb domain protein [Flammeovirgaceae bacterium 311]
MKIFSIKLLVLVLMAGALLNINSVLAQHKSIVANLRSTETRANEYFAKGAYGAALELYRQLLAGDAGNKQLMLKIAESYSRMNEQDQAVVWYEKVLDTASPVEPIHKLKYAQALTSAGNYTKAKIWYESYLKDMPEDRRAKLQVEAIAQIKNLLSDSALYQIKKLKNNSAQSDFGPAFYDDGLVFVSGREQKKPLKWVNTADHTAFFDLYFSKINADGELSEARKLQQELNSRYHEGPVTFFDNGNRILFSQNAFRNSGSKGATKKLALFEAEKSKDGNGWENIKPLPFNSDSYTVAHPTISRDGEALYFASDMPGGYGQSDLYVSRRVNGSWSKPENLGPAINTEGNEMFPFLHHNTLFFASNGLGGLGGLDIFKLEIDKAADAPQNLGVPVNSSKDDFGLILNDKNTGYFSTNRLKENKDDLYWVKYNSSGAGTSKKAEMPLATSKPATTRLKGFISEKGANTPLSGAQIYIINELTGEDLTIASDDKGFFTFEARLEDSYAIMGEKESMNIFVINIDPNDFSGGNKTIKLEADEISFKKNVVIEASLYDSLSKEPVIFAGAYLYEGIIEQQKDYTSLEGTVYFSGTKGKNYWIEVISMNHEDRRFTIPAELQASNDTLKVAIPLQKVRRSNTRVKGNIFNEATGEPVASAEIYILNEATGKAQTLYSDSKGDFSFDAKTGDTYMFTGEKGDLLIFLPNVKIKDPEKFPNSIISLNASSPIFARDFIVEALLIDSATSEPLRLAEVKFLEGGKETRAITSSAGKAYHQFTDVDEFSISAKHMGYHDYTFDLPRRNSIPKDTLKITLALKKEQPQFIVAQGYIYDKNSKSPVDQASIYLLNGKNGKEEIVKSNKDGSFQFKAALGTSYIIVGEKGDKSVFITDYVFNESKTVVTPTIELALEAPHFGNKPDEHIELEAHITDSETKESVKYVFVKIFKAGQNPEDAFADESGRVKLVLERDSDYELQLEKLHFSEKTIIISTKQPLETSLLNWELTKEKPQIITVPGTVYDLQAGAAVADADIFVLDTGTGEQLQLKADGAGNFQFPAIKGHSYTLLGEKGNISASLTDYQAASVSESNAEMVQLIVQPRKQKDIVIAATILNKFTKEPIKLASLKLLGENAEQSIAYTSPTGKGWMSAAKGKDYELTVSGLNFDSQSINISTKQSSNSDTIKATILVEPIEPVFISQAVKIISKNSGKGIAHAKVYLLNNKTGEEKYLSANDQGLFSYETKPGDIFSMIAEKGGYRAQLTKVGTKKVSDTLMLMATPPAAKELYAKVIARDKLSNEPVKFLEILLSQDQQEPRTTYTTSKGEVVFKAAPGEKFTIKTQHVNYREEHKVISFTEQAKDTTVLELYLEKLKPLYATIFVKVIDGASNLPIPNAEVLVLNEVSGEEQVLITNDQGELPLKTRLNESYSIVSRSALYKSAEMKGVRAVEGGTSLDNQLELSVVRNKPDGKHLIPGGRFEIIEVSSGARQLFVSADGILYEYVSGDSVLLRNKQEKKILSANAHHAKGATIYEEFLSYIDTTAKSSKILISNINYDFNKTSLNAAAREELKKISVIMNAYPNLSIKVNAYSDCRGSDNYNLTLSKQRAEAARTFLIALGIDSSRIKSDGFGESSLLIPCPQPTDCTLNEHQLNRRGEFILNINN